MTARRYIIVLLLSASLWQSSDKGKDCHECLKKYMLVENDSSVFCKEIYNLCELGNREGGDCPRMLLIQNYIDSYVIDRDWYFLTPSANPGKSFVLINSGFGDDFSEIKEVNIEFDSLLTTLNAYGKLALNPYEDCFVHYSEDTIFSGTIYADDNLWNLLKE